MAIIRVPRAMLRLVAVSFFLALGRIWANRTRSLLTSVGIVIAVAAVTSTVGGLTGLQRFVTSEFEAIGAKRMEIWPVNPSPGWRGRAAESFNFLPSQFRRAIEYCPDLSGLALWCTDEAPARHGTRKVEQTSLLGVENGWDKLENRPVLAGRFFSDIEQERGARVCCISAELRDKLGLDKECIGETIVLGKRTFTVIGLIAPAPQLKLLHYDRTPLPEIAVPFKTIYLGKKHWVEADAGIKSLDTAAEGQAEIRFFLRQTRRIALGDPDTFRIYNVSGDVEGFKAASVGIIAVAAGIVAISLVVGGIGIANVMFVSVRERTREIGLRKAIGARPAAIMLQFLIEAVTLSLAGGAVGVAAGYALTALVAGIPDFPAANAEVPAWAVALSVGFAGATGVISGMLPAVKAARMDAIAALRHD